MKSLIQKVIVNIILSIFILSPDSNAYDNLLRVKLSGTYYDETIIQFTAGATREFDSNYDAYKLFSYNQSVPALYTKTDAGTNLSINSLPDLTQDEFITLYTKVGATGNYTLMVEQLGRFAPHVQIILQDLKTGVCQDIKLDSTITFNVSNIQNYNSTPNRFRLYFSFPIIPALTLNANCKGQPGSAVISKSGNSNWAYILKDSIGTIIKKDTCFFEKDTLRNLNPGQYIIESLNNTASIISSSFSIGRDQQVTSYFTSEDTVEVNNASQLNLLNNSNDALNYFWDFGDSTFSNLEDPSHAYISNGEYFITLIASNPSCSDTMLKKIHVREHITNNTISATIAYAGSPYCSNIETAIVNLTGNNDGIYSSSSDLSIDSISGSIDIASSLPGTYTVTYTIYRMNETVFTTSTDITISSLPETIINYSNNSYCMNEGSVNVIESGISGGKYYSGSGLALDSLTGEINLSSSMPDTYTITYSFTDGTCYNTTNDTITINPLPVVMFSELDNVCLNSEEIILNQGSPSGGIYSGNGISDNIFDPTFTTPGEHTLKYTFIDQNGCENSATQIILVKELPIVTQTDFESICVSGTLINLNGGYPLGGIYTGNGVSNNSFNTSETGTYDITYTYTDTNGCSSHITKSLLVDVCSGINESTIVSFNISPNPSTGIININVVNSNKWLDILVINQLGETVFILNNDNGTDQIISNDLSELPNGIYFVRMKTQNEELTKKIVLQK